MKTRNIPLMNYSSVSTPQHQSAPQMMPSLLRRNDSTNYYMPDQMLLRSLTPLSLSLCPHTHMHPLYSVDSTDRSHLYHRTVAFRGYRTFPRSRYLAGISHFAYMYLPSYSGRASHAHTAPPPDSPPY